MEIIIRYKKKLRFINARMLLIIFISFLISNMNTKVVYHKSLSFCKITEKFHKLFKNGAFCLTFFSSYVIIDAYGILFYKIPKSLSAFVGLLTAVSIDGVAKMPLQASIFTPGKMILCHLNCTRIL